MMTPKEQYQNALNREKATGRQHVGGRDPLFVLSPDGDLFLRVIVKTSPALWAEAWLAEPWDVLAVYVGTGVERRPPDQWYARPGVPLRGLYKGAVVKSVVQRAET